MRGHALEQDGDSFAPFMADLADLLKTHLGILPEVVLVLRDGELARTLYGGPVGTDAVGNIGEMLRQALAMHQRRHQRQ